MKQKLSVYIYRQCENQEIIQFVSSGLRVYFCTCCN